MSPYVKRIVDAAGCPNVASSEEAEKVMRASLEEAEQFLRRSLTMFERSPMGIVAKVCLDLLMVMKMTRTDATVQVSNGDGGAMDVTALTRLLALTATSATAALKDMAFLRNAGVADGCKGCEREAGCDLGEVGAGGEDPRKG
jgi:hypothetical protein